MAVYLRVIVSSEAEFPWLLLQLREMPSWVRMRVYEPDATNVGDAKEIVFADFVQSLSSEDKSRIDYRVLPVLDQMDLSGTDEAIEANEQVVRHGFIDLFHFEPWDIVICVDADEIIYRESYLRIILFVMLFGEVQLGLRQFMFRANYLWRDYIFYAPTATFVRNYWNKPRSHWRYKGRKLSRPVGGHFSFVLTVDQMMEKLSRYRHALENARFRDEKLLSDAIRDKVYIFEPDREIDFLELSGPLEQAPPGVYPKSFYSIYGLIRERFSDAWRD